MQRRIFLKNSANACMALSVLGFSCSKRSTNAENAPTSGPSSIGIQLYTIAALLSENFRETLQMLAETGYKELEFAGPYYFSAQEEIENSIMLKHLGLKGHGYYDHTPQELKAFLDELGLRAPSAHVSMQSLNHNLAEAMNAAQIIGHDYIVCPMLVISTLDEYKAAADKFNSIGEECKKTGIRFAYHNHSLEFATLDGEIAFDMLLERTDPDLVSFELDVFWTEVAGVDPVAYFNKYPGRFPLLHIKDMAQKMEAPNTDWQTFTDPEKAQAMFARQSNIGEGIIDFQRILENAEKAGVKHYFIERDFPPNPSEFVKQSFDNFSRILT